MGKRGERYLVVSDLQVPFEHKDALAFCLAVCRDYGIPRRNVLCVGDEADQYWGSLHPKSANALHTPRQELDECRARMRPWFRAFPEMRLAESNHVARWGKLAGASGIPAELLRPWREVIGAPDGWQWKRRWDIDTRVPFTMIHGLGYSGVAATRNMVADLGVNVVHGHLHADACVVWIATDGRVRWGANAGCLIDLDAYAFEYGKDCRRKPCLGVTVILDDGAYPVFVPMGLAA